MIETDLDAWAAWLETADRSVAQTQVGEARVSTVFLGVDLNFQSMVGLAAGAPILFESMIFGGKLDGEMNRYPTWGAAEKGHAAMVERVRRAGES